VQESLIALGSAIILWVAVAIRRAAKTRQPLSIAACKRCFFLRYFIDKEFGKDEENQIHNKHSEQENSPNRRWRIFRWNKR
jgi:hypothetical protein